MCEFLFAGDDCPNKDTFNCVVDACTESKIEAGWFSLTTLTTTVLFQLNCIVRVVLPTTESLPANSLQQGVVCVEVFCGTFLVQYP